MPKASTCIAALFLFFCFSAVVGARRNFKKIKPPQYTRMLHQQTLPFTSIGRAAPEADNSSEWIGTGTPNAASFGSTCAQLCRCTSNLALAVDNLEAATSHQSVPRPQRWSSFVESVNGESAEHETLNFS